MKSETDVAARDRISVDVNDIKQRVESFRSDAAWRELSLAGKMRALVIEHMEESEQKGSSLGSASDLSESETLKLLADFLNYLIDNFDHDGFSLAEISQLLGRSDDKGLVRLVQKLQQNGQSQPKSGVKQR